MPPLSGLKSSQIQYSVPWWLNFHLLCCPELNQCGFLPFGTSHAGSGCSAPRVLLLLPFESCDEALEVGPHARKDTAFEWELFFCHFLWGVMLIPKERKEAFMAQRGQWIVKLIWSVLLIRNKISQAGEKCSFHYVPGLWQSERTQSLLIIIMKGMWFCSQLFYFLLLDGCT